jgi:transcriptional regulator with XRE-family HTH domain
MKDRRDNAIFEDLRKMVRVMRQTAGLTQLELAERLGMNRSNLSNIENGTQPVTIRNIYHISRACGFMIKVKFVPIRRRRGEVHGLTSQPTLPKSC